MYLNKEKIESMAYDASELRRSTIYKTGKAVKEIQLTLGTKGCRAKYKVANFPRCRSLTYDWYVQ